MRAMDTELGVRIATRDRNLTFVTSETDAAIVIVGHLPGIRQVEIDISVNEEGTAVTISGRGQRFLSHAVTSGRRLRISNEVETRPFWKVFRIPNGVSLDQIDAGFDEQGGVLMVLMPKRTRGQNSPHEVDAELEGPVQDTIQPDEENSASQKRPHEPETSEAGRGGDSKTSEQETPPIQQTIKRIEQDDSDSNRTSENQQSTDMNPKDYIKKREKEPDPPPNPTTETIEALDQDGKPPQMDALEPNVEAEQEEPLKEADLDVQTSETTAPQQDQPRKTEVEDDAPEPKMDALEPNAVREQEEPIEEADPVVQTSEATAPQQDQPGKAVGEDDTPERNVLPDLPQPKRQEAGGGEVSSEKPTDRPPTMEKLAGTDNVVAESRQQVVDATNEGDENDEETGSEASSEERRTDGDEKPEGEETAKKERVGRRRRRRAGNGRASSLSHHLPQLVGSAFILSLVALVVHYMRNKRRGPS